MQQLLARATGQAAGSLVRFAASGSTAPTAAWATIDDVPDAASTSAEPARAVVDAAPRSGPPHAAAVPARLPNDMPNAPARAERQSLRADSAGRQPDEPNPFAAQSDRHDPKPAASGASVAAGASPAFEARRPAPLLSPRRAPWPMAGIEHPPFAPPLPARVARRRDAEPSSAEAARATEPVVHVSIGRVELTALVAPAASRPKAASRQPATSLADYLRNDAGRSRK